MALGRVATRLRSLGVDGAALATVRDPTATARFLAFLLAGGATLGLVSMTLPQPPGTSFAGIYTVLAASYATAALTLGLGARHPRLVPHLALATGTVLISFGIYFTGQTMSVYSLFYVLIGLGGFYFLSLGDGYVHVVLVAVAYAALLAVQQTADGAERWLITVGTVLIAGVLVGLMRRRVDQLVSELQHAVSRLELIARTDPLTGVHNRRGFTEQLDHELARGARSGEPCALLIADLDHFKRVNDRFGHAAGDAALTRTAAVLQAAVRRGDVVARLGGEEFAAVLPETGAEDAHTIAERLRTELAGSFAADELPLTISVGLACAPADGSAAADLVDAADRALYLAKRLGRNRTVVASGAAASRAPAGAGGEAVRVGR